MRRAKIICTLGPATHSAEAIGRLMDCGMNVARLNFSHGDETFHRESLDWVRQEAARRGLAVAILADLPGPKIRVGQFADGKVDLVAGDPFILTTEERLGDTRGASTSYVDLPGDVKPGDSILLDDGLLQLEVVRVAPPEVETRVVVGGQLRDRKGLNLPGVRISAPTLTEHDRQLIARALAWAVDYVAVSFVRSADDIVEAQHLLTRADGSRVPVIAKIERPEAVADLERIIEAADGIMVARGDLGVELGQEKVPLVQKHAICLAGSRGKLDIVATQMLESMTEHPQPTRAEASDVANAVLDGADALMLSGETAAGRYPDLAVRTMARIIEEIEGSPLYRAHDHQPGSGLSTPSAAIAHAAAVASRQLDAKVIASLSSTGGVAWLLSSYRPEARIIAFTDREDTFRRLALCWGILPVRFAAADSAEATVLAMASRLRADHHGQPGDLAVITLGAPIGAEPTNLMKVQRLS